MRSINSVRRPTTWTYISKSSGSTMSTWRSCPPSETLCPSTPCKKACLHITFSYSAISFKWNKYNTRQMKHNWRQNKNENGLFVNVFVFQLVPSVRPGLAGWERGGVSGVHAWGAGAGQERRGEPEDSVKSSVDAVRTTAAFYLMLIQRVEPLLWQYSALCCC